ncbi:hypothetical protein DRH27_00130 [Candidatus Falkowbacteria bacterium]|nr:MAG: hypothetical protein DRH27_00130 [Candidatus Falkowbacteria bacterium]
MPNINNIALYGQTIPLRMGLIASFGYFDFVGQPDDSIPNHVERALNLLVEQFTDREQLKAAAAIFVKETQNIEDVLSTLKLLKDLDTQTGDQLDMIGELVGEERNFRTDDNYREAIRLRIFVNKSSGEPETIIEAFQAIMNPTEMHLREIGNATLLINFKSVFTPPSDLRERIELIASSGVKIILTWSIDDDPDFAFDGEGGYPPEANTLGFGETGVGNVLEGGRFVELIT